MQDLKPTFEHYFPEGSLGGQCGIFAHKVVDFPLVGDTIISKRAAVNKFGIPRPALVAFRAGDVLILDIGTKAGHVAIVNCVIGQTLQLTESNWKLDQKIHHTRIIPQNNSQIVGVIRGALKVQALNPNLMQKVLVLWSNIAQAEKDPVSAGIAKYLGSVALKTANAFTINCDFADTTQQFHTITANNPDGSAVTFANPDEIAAAAEAVRPNVAYDIVCLIYNDANVIGSPPNHPVDNPTIQFGFNICSIPQSWLMAPANQSGQQAFDFIVNEAAQFFAHEISHANYYLANNKGGASQRDRTHDANPYQQADQVYLFFVDLILELKTWWQFLAATGQTPPPVERKPVTTYKFTDNATEYVLTDDATLIPITATGLTKTLAGRPENLVNLAPSERAKYHIVSSVVN